jgi:hypothetical protein
MFDATIYCATTYGTTIYCAAIYGATMFGSTIYSATNYSATMFSATIFGSISVFSSKSSLSHVKMSKWETAALVSLFLFLCLTSGMQTGVRMYVIFAQFQVNMQLQMYCNV